MEVQKLEKNFQGKHFRIHSNNNGLTKNEVENKGATQCRAGLRAHMLNFVDVALGNLSISAEKLFGLDPFSDKDT